MMKSLIVLALSVIATSSQYLDRCSVVRAVRATGLPGYKGYTVGDYVCLAYYASRYNTALNNSPTEYGLYQINSYWWCDDGKTPGRKNGCRVKCNALLNTNIFDDLACVRRIVSDPNGLDAWTPWRKSCKGRNNAQFAKGC